MAEFKEIKNHRIKLEGAYNDEGLYQGTHRFWDEQGRIKFEAEFKDGCQTRASHYFLNGKLESQLNYVTGHLHGPQKFWFPNGEIKSESNMIHGIPHGIQKVFFISSQLKTLKKYEDGSLIEAQEWNIKGGEVI